MSRQENRQRRYSIQRSIQQCGKRLDANLADDVQKLIYKHQFEKAARIIKPRLSATHNTTLLSQGAHLALFYRNDLDEAEMLLSRALGIKPDDPRNLRMAGDVNAAKGYFETALKYYRLSIQFTQPDSKYIPITLGKIAETFLKMKQPTQALTVVEERLSLNKDDVAAWHDKFKILMLIGKQEDALHAADEVVRLAPDTRHNSPYRRLIRAAKQAVSSYQERTVDWDYAPQV